MAGDAVSGITTMQMDAGLDTGDMLLCRAVPITPDTTYGTLHDALMEMGAALIVETMEQLAAGRLVRTPQTGESCYAPRITRETAQIDWSRPARELDALVRGLNRSIRSGVSTGRDAPRPPFRARLCPPIQRAD